MKKVTFIHAADLHLDSPMVGLKNLPKSIFNKLQESTFVALKKITDLAIVHRVDFVIFAGDLFDGEHRSIRAQIRFRKEMERLAAHQIRVFAVHGNHDHLEGKWTHVSMPSNVHIFSHEPEAVSLSLNEQTMVHLYGFSYPKRHVYERMIDHYKKKEEADFHIGILHGNLDGSSDHDGYSPFTINDLLHKEFDYWALGHIHKSQILHLDPPIIYSGNTQGRHRKETGDKGCFIVHLTDEGADFELIETSSVIWQERSVDASSACSFEDLYQMTQNLIQSSRMENRGMILSILLNNVSIPAIELKNIWNGELLEALQDEEKDENDFVWVSNISIHETVQWNRQQLMQDSDFYQLLFSTISDHKLLNGSLSTFYEHPDARKMIERLSEEETLSIAKEAENLLVTLLNKQ